MGIIRAWAEPGGGGFGLLGERDPPQVQDDLCNGMISPEVARALYGYRGNRA